MKKGTRVQTVKIQDLKTNHFVRAVFDSDRAMALAELIDNHVTLPRIIVSSEMDLIDGRHRKEAYEVCQIEEVEADVVYGLSETEMIAMAYKANVGGALPPSREDTEHTIKELLERNVSKRKIASLLGMPPSLAMKYVETVQTRMTHAKLQRAAIAITEEGLTIAKAAEKYKVDIQKLKELISGRRRKHKQGVAEVRRLLTFAHKSLSSRNGRLMRDLLAKYDDGDVSTKQVEAVFAHVEQLQNRHERVIADWKKRFTSRRPKKP